jgi:hypothetical protein
MKDMRGCEVGGSRRALRRDFAGQEGGKPRALAAGMRTEAWTLFYVEVVTPTDARPSAARACSSGRCHAPPLWRQAAGALTRFLPAG